MDQIIGQERAIEVLQASLQGGRLHHAYIFHGPAGVGKFTTAVAFARVLLCHEPQRDLAGRVVACEGCASCKLLASTLAGTEAGKLHPDFHVVTKELARFSDDKATRERKLITIPFDVLREQLIDPVYKSAQLRHNKAVIVDEAELIDPRGQNILLKTLEEPPVGTFLILVTASEDRLLPTIRSRCQRVAFLPLPDAAIQQWTGKAAGIGDWSVADKKWLVDFAGGSFGRARLAVDYGLAAWARSILPAIDAMAQRKFVSTLGKEIGERIEEFAKRWVDEHENASKEAANKLAATLMWAMISQHARRKLAELSARPNAGGAELSPWLGVIDALGQAELEIGSNVNLGLAADHLASRLYRAMTGETMLAGSF